VSVNLGLVVWAVPYYFAYYNPLAGGVRAAARTMTIGWGDGLDKAAAWLDAKPNAAALKVASWYGSTFAPYFRGETIRYSDQKGNALAGDYIVFYVNQRQRHYPDDEIWRYINDHFSLEKTIFLRGVPYAWIFPAPGIGHYVEDQRYQGIGSLLGWDWRGPATPDDGPIAAGSALPVSVYWEYLGKTPEEAFFVRLIGLDGNIWAEATTRPAPEFAGADAWRQGQIIEERGDLPTPGSGVVGDRLPRPGALLLDDRFRDILDANPARRCGGDLKRDLVGKGAEFLRAGHKIRLAIDLHHHTHAAVAVAVELEASVAGLATGSLFGFGQAFFSQDRDCLLNIPAGFFERLAAIQDARARFAAQCFDVRG